MPGSRRDNARVPADERPPVPPFALNAVGGGWARVDSLPAGRTAGAAWVAVAELRDLVTAARDNGVAEATIALLERRVERLDEESGRPRAYAHVDRSPTGDLLMSVPTTWWDEGELDVRTGEITLVVCRSLVLSAERGAAGVLGRTAQRLESKAPTPDSGPREVLAALLFTVLSQGSEVEIGLGEAVAATERIVFSRDRADPVERIYRLKREIAEARRALNPVQAALPEFEAQAEDERGRGAAWSWLPRIQDTVDRLDRHLVAHDGLLGDMLQAHLTQMSVRQNEDMRRISAWAAMITVPTLIAGIYGMNFRHMPELSWVVGYPLSIAVMAGACWLLYRAFRRSGWL